MHIRKGKAPGSGRLARIGVELSRGARVRLAWMDFYRGCDNVAHTCRHFGISRQTFYRWQRRYDPYDLTTLEEHSHAPEFRDRDARYGLALTPCANPNCTRCLSPATWSKSTPWTSVPFRAWSLNSSPPATWFPAGTCCKRTPAPQLKPPLSSSTPCSSACPFLSGRCRSTAVPSSPPSSNRLASSGASICSSCPHALPNSTALSNAPIAPTPRSSTR